MTSSQADLLQLAFDSRVTEYVAGIADFPALLLLTSFPFNFFSYFSSSVASVTLAM
jgi:hypothetical protein